MFENIINFFKNIGKNGKENSKETAKERLHLVLAQDRANISADFLEMMKQEIIEVIKKYIEIDEKAIDVRLTNKSGDDGTVGAPSLYANIPIVTIKNEARKIQNKEEEESTEKEKEEDLKQIEKISEEEKPETEEKSTKKESEKEVTKENEEEKELGIIGKSPNEKNEKENKEDIVSNENDNDNEVSNEETNS